MDQQKSWWRGGEMLGYYQQDFNCSFRTKDSDYLEDTVYVFKLIGPVLIKKETPEARTNVDVYRRYPCTKTFEINGGDC